MPALVPDVQALFALVRRTRAFLRFGAVGTGMAWTVAALAFLWSVAPLADLVFPCVGPWVRLPGLLLATGGPLFVFGWRVVGPLTKAWPTVEVARRIETHVPNIQRRLVSCFDLAEQAEPPSAFFHKLVAEASERMRPFRPSTVVNRKTLCWSVGTAIGGVWLFALVWLCIGPAFTTALARIASPFADVPPYSRTSFVIEKPSATGTLLRGEPTTFIVTVEGPVPDGVTLELSGNDTTLRYELEPETLTKTLTGLSSVRGLEEGFTYRVYGGGTWSVARHVRWVDQPTVDDVRVRVRFPAYLNETRDNTPPDRDAVGPEGSTCELTVTTSRDVILANVQRQAWHTTYKFGSQGAWPFRVQAKEEQQDTETFPLERVDETHWRGSFPLVGRGTYQVEVRNESGYTNTPWHDPPRYQAIPDAAPSVRVTKPGTDLIVEPNQRVPLQLTVRDDYGLRDVVLCVARGDKPFAPVRTLKSYSETMRADSLTTELDVGSKGLALQKNEVLRYRVEVRDQHPTRSPTRSPEFTLRLASDGTDTNADANLLADQGQQTANELNELKNTLQALREKLQQRHGQQEDLANQTEQAPDQDLPQQEKKQNAFDDLLRKDLDLTKKILEREKAKRGLTDDPMMPPDMPEAKADPMAVPKKENPTATDSPTPKKDGPSTPMPPFAPLPGLKGENDKLDPKTLPKITLPKRDRRDELRQHQKDNLDKLDSAQKSLESDEAALEKMIRELLDASDEVKKNSKQGSPNTKDLMRMLQGANMQNAKQMAQRAKDAKSSAGQSSQQAATTGTRSTDGNALGLPSSLAEFDAATRATIMQLPPRVREELLQGMKAAGPEGYQKYIQEYFRRLEAVP